jgi:hypothetical protein
MSTGKQEDGMSEKSGWEKRYDDLHAEGNPMPGPWSWTIHDHSMATLSGGGEDAIVGHIMALGPCEACAERARKGEWKWGRCQTPLPENARLIQASPDLLAACMEADKFLAGLKGRKAAVARNIVKAAISRATQGRLWGDGQ